MTDRVLEATGLRVEVVEGDRTFFPVDGVSLEVSRGGALGIVGESGSGKTLTMRALLGLLPSTVRLVEGRIRFATNGQLEEVAPTTLRGSGIAMVFQEPMAALNPLLRAGDLVADAYRATHDCSRADARVQAFRLLGEVQIPAPEERARAYPHQLSGGLRQRVMIATALASEPKLLLCDEPTTALDVTVQQQIVELLNRIRRQRGLALVYVTHDLALVGDICDRLAVMYAGRIVELGAVKEVLSRPAHPYTQALLRSVPRLDTSADALTSIPGAPPDPRHYPVGCRFAPRCGFAQEDCRGASFQLEPVRAERASACIHHERVWNAREAPR
jgi:oligopeptide/dipeptide ABC transporter ATP-binding protein